MKMTPTYLRQDSGNKQAAQAEHYNSSAAWKFQSYRAIPFFYIFDSLLKAELENDK